MGSDKTPLAIGEVSERTGVNTVTLRAWQRRYGLLKPQRTPKGHRLYSEHDVERIKEILSWLHKGVAVSQVKQLLGKHDVVSAESAQNLPEVAMLKDAVMRFDARFVNNCLSELTKNYPISTLKTTVLDPLSDWFSEQNTDVMKMCDSFWCTSLAYVLVHCLHNNQKASTKKPCWMVAVQGNKAHRVYLHALLLQSKGYSVTIVEGTGTGLAALHKTLIEQHTEKMFIYSDCSFTASLKREVESVLASTVLITELLGECRLIHPELVNSATLSAKENLEHQK
ncbi:helix-turn-helix-type transcriptional regulator [Enterovibrio norvegicus FF-162]|uniref:MerR family transcriptional regulator n=1 Tax=Enterovibrio norvegicus TaxID=188144 RepID=UPI0003159ED7|nr:MerR family transcriptional regulator [Enterovibrio norvegicus]OEE77325.1 helix-turn-helix-type transcriptional regulator [Enterovibrio norvegicus FF-162]